MRNNYLIACMSVLFLLTSARGAPTKALDKPLRNPVSSIMKTVLYRQTNNLVGLAEAMPAEKYGFRPAPHEPSLASVVIDIARTNNSLCAAAGTVEAPKSEEPKETDSKEKLVGVLKASFTFCKTALAKLHDTELGEAVPFSAEGYGPRADALFTLLDTWSDGYRRVAIYLRLNGLEPPEKEMRFAP